MLARMLGGYGASARAERRSRGDTPDVRVDLRTGDSVLLECKWDGSRRLLEEQLDERLGDFPDALGLIGVLYPERLRRLENVEAALEVAQDIKWWLHGSRGEKTPERRIRTGSAAELSDHLRALPLELEGADLVIAATGVVGYAVERSAEEIARHRRMSRLITDLIAQTDQEKDLAAAAAHRLPGSVQRHRVSGQTRGCKRGCSDRKRSMESGDWRTARRMGQDMRRD